MAEPVGPFHLLRAGPGRYLCYCRPGPGPGGTVLRWVPQPRGPGPGPSAQGPADPGPSTQVPPLAQSCPHREALGRGAARLSLAEGKARLELREEEVAAARCSALDLFKLPVAEARSQLQVLMFGMAGCIESLERRLEADLLQSLSCLSPTEADPSPRKNRSAGLVLPARRKIPGESLINPGFKSKKVPSGVDFEDS
ncbi:PAXX protein, partial [Nyctibius bracteatus]|nr:PAXX protein [Nyctibius bracteatus]